MVYSFAAVFERLETEITASGGPIECRNDFVLVWLQVSTFTTRSASGAALSLCDDDGGCEQDAPLPRCKGGGAIRRSKFDAIGPAVTRVDSHDGAIQKRERSSGVNFNASVVRRLGLVHTKRQR
jgi:hypothetical protein